MIKGNKLLMLLAVAGAISEQGGTGYSARKNKMYERKKGELLPTAKGCKQYFFNQYGEFNNDSMEIDECVFKCNSLNDRSAQNKFSNWSKTQNV